MHLLQSIEDYTKAQRGVGLNFMILGLILIMMSIFVTLVVTKSPLATGLKWGTVVTGFLIIIGGFSYRIYSENMKNRAIEVYKESPVKFLNSEHKRMQTAVKAYNYYQLGFALFIVAALIVILFSGSQVAKGASFAVALLHIGVMIVEGFSHYSILKYAHILGQEILQK